MGLARCIETRHPDPPVLRQGHRVEDPPNRTGGDHPVEALPTNGVGEDELPGLTRPNDFGLPEGE